MRRSQRKRKPVIKEDYVSYFTIEQTEENPITVKEAMESPQKKNWIEAMNQEYEALQRNKTWEYVKQPKDKKLLTTKWIFKIKHSEKEKPRYKARLVVRGCAQTQGIDYYETYSPVVRYTTIRYLLALAAKENLEISHMDVTAAYLNSDLEEDIYVKPPEEYKSIQPEGKIWKLKKAVYGLKQSGRSWNKRLDEILKDYGLTKSKADPCVYQTSNARDRLIVAVYVDDLLILSNKQTEIKELKEHLPQRKLYMKDLGKAQRFLGMNKINNSEEGEIKIHQKEYIEKALTRFQMENCNPVATPADPNTKLTKEMGPKDKADIEEMKNTPYLEAVGTLLYISQISRPNIAYAVNNVSCFCNNPGKAHWNAVKRIFRYLKGTKDYKLKFCKNANTNIIGFSDADWANDQDSRKSITGSVFLGNGAAISWYSKRQHTVTLSTVEAEYVALAFTCQEALWLRELIRETEPWKEIEPIELFCDNNGAICLTKNAALSQRTKHIDVRHHFVRESVENKGVTIKHLSTDEMIADMFTNPLTRNS